MQIVKDMNHGKKKTENARISKIYILILMDVDILKVEQEQKLPLNRNVDTDKEE